MVALSARAHLTSRSTRRSRRPHAQEDTARSGERPEPPPPRQVDVEVKVVQLDGNTKVIQSFCRTHLRYEAEYGLKRGTCTNCYLLVDGDEALLVDVPRSEYLAVFRAWNG